MSTREQQKEIRREEILAAGLDLFIRKGYSATKIKDIAEQVGMSVGLLFHYFGSKEMLYEELITLGITGPMSVMELDRQDPLEFFRTVARQIFQHLKEETFTAKMFVFMSQAFYNEALTDRIKEKLREFDIYSPTVDLIKKGQENGTIREGDPYALAIAFWSSIQGIAVEIAQQPEIPCPDSEWIVDILRRQHAQRR